jgi:selenocysteine-specific elongation factor
VEEAQPGVRLAVNVSGLSRSDIERGQVLTPAGWLPTTMRVDARFRMVKNAPHSLRHNEGVTFHIFTSESPARVRLLDADRLTPGNEGWVQMLLSNPLPMVKGDFFVIRSAEDTLGGGQVVDPNPRRRHRRFSTEVVERLMTLDEGTGEDILLSVADQWGPCGATALSRRSNLPVEEVMERVGRLEEDGDMVVLGDLAGDSDAVVYSTQGWNILKSKVALALQRHHNQFPLRRGAPTQEIRSRLEVPQPVFLKAVARLTSEGFLAEDRTSIRLPDHEVSLTPQMEQQAAAYVKSLEDEPYSPPSDQRLDPELLTVLVEDGKVVKVNESIVFSSSAYRDMSDRVVERLKSNGSITVAEARTMFNTSRKYILPFLEYLDQQQITRRVGDDRVLR